MAGAASGILFRLGISHIPPLGPIAYLGMIIVMGQTLNYEIQESRRHMQTMLDHVPAQIFMKDTMGRYVMANRLFEEKFHITNATLYGKTDYDILPREQAEAYHAADQEALSRLNLRPVFVGIERDLIRAAIDAEPQAIRSRLADKKSPDEFARPDRAGGWIIPLGQERRIIGGA